MKETFKITGVLTFVCIVCAFLLSYVHGIASEKIKLNAEKRIENAISNLAPWAKTIKEIKNKEKIIYELLDNQDTLKGYAFLAEGQGYQGKIKMLAVVDSSLTRLKGIEVVESTETPGLGAKIQEEPFSSQFKNLKISPLIDCLKEEPVKDNQVQAITGATVSSRAVVNILNKRIKELKEEIIN